MKRKKGRGIGYNKALVRNLARSLFIHKKIITSKYKARLASSAVIKQYGGSVKTYQIGKRRGDGSLQILVIWKKDKDKEAVKSAKQTTKSKKNGNKTNKK